MPRADVGHALGVQASEERVEQVLREAEPREHQQLAALVDARARAGRRVEASARLLASRARDAALDPLEAALRLLVSLCLQAISAREQSNEQMSGETNITNSYH